MADYEDSWRAGGTGRGAYVFQARDTAQVPVTVKGYAGQTVNLFEAQQSDGTVVFDIDNNGNISFSGSATIAIDEAVTGSLVVNGDTTLGDSSVDTLTVNATTTFVGDITTQSQFVAGDGTALDPAFTFTSDPNTGMYLAASDKLGFSTGGSRRLHIDNTTTEIFTPYFKVDNATDETSPVVSITQTPTVATLNTIVTITSGGANWDAGSYGMDINVTSDSSIRGYIATVNSGQTGFAMRDGLGNITGTWISGSSSTAFTTGGNRDFLLQPGGTGTVKINGPMVYVPSSVTDISAGETIAATEMTMRVQGDGGPITQTATPAISAGVDDGQLIILEGSDDAKVLTVQDNSSNAGSTLKLNNGLDFLLGAGDKLFLQWNLARTSWEEISRSDN